MTPESQSQPNQHAQSAETLLAGRVLRPHGIRGYLLIASDANYFSGLKPGVQLFFGENNIPGTIISLHPHQKRYLLNVDISQDRDQAEKLRGKQISISLEDLPELTEGEYFYWQILGLQVKTDSGETLGILENILETGANDVYVVKTPQGDELLLPAIKDVIRDVSLEQKCITVHLLPGLITPR